MVFQNSIFWKLVKKLVQSSRTKVIKMTILRRNNITNEKEIEIFPPQTHKGIKELHKVQLSLQPRENTEKRIQMAVRKKAT